MREGVVKWQVTLDNRDNEPVYTVATNGLFFGLKFSYEAYKSSLVAGGN